jgi:hypothetical protein
MKTSKRQDQGRDDDAVLKEDLELQREEAEDVRGGVGEIIVIKTQDEASSSCYCEPRPEKAHSGSLNHAERFGPTLEFREARLAERSLACASSNGANSLIRPQSASM